jgi:hypothetical protein
LDFLESQVPGSRKDAKFPGSQRRKVSPKNAKNSTTTNALNYLHNAGLHNVDRTRLSETIKPHIVVRLSYTS